MKLFSKALILLLWALALPLVAFAQETATQTIDLGDGYSIVVPVDWAVKQIQPGAFTLSGGGLTMTATTPTLLQKLNIHFDPNTSVADVLVSLALPFNGVQLKDENAELSSSEGRQAASYTNTSNQTVDQRYAVIVLGDGEYGYLTVTSIKGVLEDQQPVIDAVIASFKNVNTPTATPTIATPTPTASATVPTDTPTYTPTSTPTVPTDTPTDMPTDTPTDTPTTVPSSTPTTIPSSTPTVPTTTFTNTATTIPSDTPTVPTDTPTAVPSSTPTVPTTTFANTATTIPSAAPTTMPTATATVPTATPTGTVMPIPSDTPSGTPALEGCTVSIDRKNSATLRVGPGTNRGAISYLLPNLMVTVTGRTQLADGTIWFQLDKSQAAPNGTFASELWVAAADVSTHGDCVNVGVVVTPPIIRRATATPEGDEATSEVTSEPTAEPTTEPTSAATGEPSAEPTEKPTKAPTREPATAQPTDTIPPTSAPVEGSIVPANGLWTLTFNAQTNTSCQGGTNSIIASSDVFQSMTFSDALRAIDTDKISFGADTYVRVPGTNTFTGQFTLENSANAQVWLTVNSTTSILGQVTNNFNQGGTPCSATALFLLQRQ